MHPYKHAKPTILEVLFPPSKSVLLIVTMHSNLIRSPAVLLLRAVIQLADCNLA